MKVSSAIAGIIIFLFIYFFFLYSPRSPEDDIKELTDKEKEQYKDYNKRLTPHEQDILKHPEYWGNPLNQFFYNLFNKKN